MLTPTTIKPGQLYINKLWPGFIYLGIKAIYPESIHFKEGQTFLTLLIIKEPIGKQSCCVTVAIRQNLDFENQRYWEGFEEYNQ